MLEDLIFICRKCPDADTVALSVAGPARCDHLLDTACHDRHSTKPTSISDVAAGNQCYGSVSFSNIYRDLRFCSDRR